MSNDIEYIEPTQEHIGQMVEIEHAGSWTKRKLLAVLPEPQVYRFICERFDCNNEFAIRERVHRQRHIDEAKLSSLQIQRR